MSSYSSSIKAIINGRAQLISESMQSTKAQALLIAMRVTPRHSILPAAESEITTVRRLCEAMALEPVEPGRHKEDILLHLPESRIFHFAGHGYTDVADPSESKLLLEDWESNALTLANLLEINLREHSPFLAYLSACGTGEVKDKKFFDENIHLINACQLAGFRHVVGTMWKVDDEVCVNMAKFTYQGIMDGEMTDESVCLGLHQATRQLRDVWLSALAKTKRGQRLARERAAFNTSKDVGTMITPDACERKGEMLRDADLDEEEEHGAGPANWVPYVHYGI
ncbi:hypothetical protein ACLMJK_009399 [Lecanora helva]